MRQKVLLLLAAFFGALAFILTYQQLEAEKRRIAGDAETLILIKLARDMVEGEELKESDLVRHAVKRQRENAVLSREIPWSEVHRIIGRKLESSMAAGQILQTTDLQPFTNRNGFNNIVQAGWRAIAVPVDGTSSVNYLVQPNDNVDVIGTFVFPDMRGDSSVDTVTLTLLQNVKVLAVGNRWGSGAIDPSGNRNYNTVTLQVYPDEVEMLIFAAQKGRLTLSLRNYDDKRIVHDSAARSINFKLLEKEIPKFNQRREERRRAL